MTEVVVALLVLVPLFLLIPVLAKYGHAQRMTQQAARNAAWEATASANYALSDAPGLEARMRARSFARATAPIRTVVGRTTAFDDPMLNTFSGRTLIRPSTMHARNSETRGPGFASASVGRLPSSLPGEFPPNRNGYVTAQVDLSFENLRMANGRRSRYLAPFDGLDLTLQRRQTLLADPWNAAGPGHGRNPNPRAVVPQVASLVPTSNLAFLNPVFETLGRIPLPLFDRLGQLRLGHVEPDVVPFERLDRYPVRR